MGFWRLISPRRAVEDFAHEWRQPNPYRWRVLGVSVAATFALMMLLLPESERIQPRPPQVTWITTFAEGRTDDEIVASNLENQQRKDRLAAEAAERAERRREAYRALGRATGVDVDSMEAEIERERAAEQPAAPQARAPVER
jgi:hypothetical protein